MDFLKTSFHNCLTGLSTPTTLCHTKKNSSCKNPIKRIFYAALVIFTSLEAARAKSINITTKAITPLGSIQPVDLKTTQGFIQTAPSKLEVFNEVEESFNPISQTLHQLKKQQDATAYCSIDQKSYECRFKNLPNHLKRWLPNCLEGLHETQSMEFRNISVDDFDKIFEIAKMAPSIDSFTLSKSHLSPSDIKKLIDHLKEFKELQSLHLADNQLDSQAIEYIIKNISKLKNFKHLYLANNALTDDAAKLLIDKLKKAKNLFTLDLSNNSIGDETAQYFIDKIESLDHLKVLIMKNNQLSDKKITLLQSKAKEKSILTSL